MKVLKFEKKTAKKKKKSNFSYSRQIKSYAHVTTLELVFKAVNQLARHALNHSTLHFDISLKL